MNSKTYHIKENCGEATSTTREISNKAKELLKEMYKEGTPIRLVGVRVDGLTEKEETQLSLFKNEENEKQEKIDKAIDKIKEKYGYNAITRAGEMNIKNIFGKNTKI